MNYPAASGRGSKAELGNKMLRVYTAQHPTEAHIVKGLLESHDIESCVKGDILFSVRGEIPLTTETAPSVWIYEDSRYREARSIVEEYEKTIKRKTSRKDNWSCKLCGEAIEGQFTHCWKCNTPQQKE